MLFRTIRRLIAALALIATSLDSAATLSPASAQERPAVYVARNAPAAVGGYDLTSYFAGSGQPVLGVAAFSARHGGATYRFANAANRDRFAASPERYLPRYGGYCAYAVSQGSTAPGDPAVYRVVDGKLYLNVSRGVQRTWERDIPGYVRRADANWPRVLSR